MRSPARKRRPPRKSGFGDGRWIGYGPMVFEGRRGVHYPRSLCVRQDGIWVLAQHSRGSRDRPDSY